MTVLQASLVLLGGGLMLAAWSLALWNIHNPTEE